MPITSVKKKNLNIVTKRNQLFTLIFIEQTYVVSSCPCNKYFLLIFTILNKIVWYWIQFNKYFIKIIANLLKYFYWWYIFMRRYLLFSIICSKLWVDECWLLNIPLKALVLRHWFLWWWKEASRWLVSLIAVYNVGILCDI